MIDERIKQYNEDNKDDVYKVLRYAIAHGDRSTARSIIKSGQVDLRKEHKTKQEPLLFILVSCSCYHLQQKKELIRLMVAHGANIHIRYRGVNILTPAWRSSTATIEFLLSEYKFSNKEMLNALNCTSWNESRFFISLKDLRFFRKHGLKLDAKTVETLLFDAVDRCDAEMTEFLLDSCNISANCVNEYGFTPLHKASGYREGGFYERFSKYRKVAKILLDHGADVNSKVKNSDVTPLMLARDIDIFKFLLKHGADIHAVTRNRQQNMLMKQAGNRTNSIVHQPLPIVKLLVEKYHFDVRKKDKKGIPVLSFALEVKNLEVAAYLLEKGAATAITDVDSYVRQFRDPDNKFRDPDNQQYPKLLKCLIKHGMGVDSEGKNVLFYAANYSDLLSFLQMGADASIVANDGTTSLMNFQLDCGGFSLLVEHGADPNKTPGGVQGLFTWWLNQESKLGCEAILLYLIKKYSLDPNTKDKDGRTALFYTRFTIPDLLDLGARIDLVDNAGNTPLMYWCISGGIVEYHFKALNHRNHEGKNALHYAVRYEQPSMIQNLLDHGVDCNIKDNSGKTALDYAREWKRTDLYDLLENCGTMKQHN